LKGIECTEEKKKRKGNVENAVSGMKIICVEYSIKGTMRGKEGEICTGGGKKRNSLITYAKIGTSRSSHSGKRKKKHQLSLPNGRGRTRSAGPKKRFRTSPPAQKKKEGERKGRI